MKSSGSRPHIATTVKIAALCAGAGALVIMGAVTLEPWLSDAVGSQFSVFVADTDTAPATTATVASAVPPVKATTFVGGDWPGMPSAH